MADDRLFEVDGEPLRWSELALWWRLALWCLAWFVVLVLAVLTVIIGK